MTEFEFRVRNERTQNFPEADIATSPLSNERISESLQEAIQTFLEQPRELQQSIGSPRETLARPDNLDVPYTEPIYPRPKNLHGFYDCAPRDQDRIQLERRFQALSGSDQDLVRLVTDTTELADIRDTLLLETALEMLETSTGRTLLTEMAANNTVLNFGTLSGAPNTVGTIDHRTQEDGDVQFVIRLNDIHLYRADTDRFLYEIIGTVANELKHIETLNIALDQLTQNGESRSLEISSAYSGTKSYVDEFVSSIAEGQAKLTLLGRPVTLENLLDVLNASHYDQEYVDGNFRSVGFSEIFIRGYGENRPEARLPGHTLREQIEQVLNKNGLTPLPEETIAEIESYYNSVILPLRTASVDQIRAYFDRESSGR